MVALLLGDNILTCSFPGCGGFAFQKGHKGSDILCFFNRSQKAGEEEQASVLRLSDWPIGKKKTAQI